MRKVHVDEYLIQNIRWLCHKCEEWATYYRVREGLTYVEFEFLYKELTYILYKIDDGVTK